MSKKESTTDLTISENTVLQEVPDFLKNNSGQARGTEQVSSDDLMIPRLELVQDLSPCRKKTDPQYIPGCEEGMFYNNISRQLYGTSVLVIPVYFKKEWLIWKNRDAGGGFRGAFDSERLAKEALINLEDADDCEIVDTAQMFCLVYGSSSNLEEAVISMSKSKMKASRAWNSLIRLAGGDSFSRVYKIESFMDTNSKNQTFYNFKISNFGFPTQAVYEKAESLYNSIRNGGITVDRTFDSEAETVVGSEEY